MVGVGTPLSLLTMPLLDRALHCLLNGLTPIG
jgi:hypothetical protein